MNSAARNANQAPKLDPSNTEAFRERWQRELAQLVPDRAGKTIMALRWYHWRDKNRVILRDSKRFPRKVGLDLLAAATSRSRSAIGRDIQRFEKLGFLHRIDGGTFGDEFELTIPGEPIPTGIHNPIAVGFPIPTTGTHKPSLPSNPIKIGPTPAPAAGAQASVTVPSSAIGEQLSKLAASLRVGRKRTGDG